VLFALPLQFVFVSFNLGDYCFKHSYSYRPRVENNRREQRSIIQSINQSIKRFLSSLNSGTTVGLGPGETVSWCTACSQEKTSWTGVSRGDDDVAGQWFCCEYLASPHDVTVL